MSITNVGTVKCDQCAKTVETDRARLPGSHWLHISPISKTPFAVIGKPTIFGKDFCQIDCLTKYCVALELS